jgi:hypothetical protein
LGETIEIMSDIDQSITKHGGFPFPWLCRYMTKHKNFW